MEPEGEQAREVSARMEVRREDELRMWAMVQKQIMWALLLELRGWISLC